MALQTAIRVQADLLTMPKVKVFIRMDSSYVQSEHALPKNN